MIKFFSYLPNKVNKTSSLILFLLWFAGLYFFFEYNHIIGMKPQSYHEWRASDCASFALEYYHHGMDFFHPRVHNVLTGEGNCAGECPILYYFIAILYKIFGVHDLIFRMVNLLFLFFGLISLYQLVRRITDDYFFAHVIPLLFFSSPLIAFFGNNFIADVPAISCVFMALNFIFKYKETQKLKFFYLCMFFFCLGALLKLNSAISFVSLMALFFFELNSWITLNNSKKLFVHIRSNIFGFAIAAIIIAAWYRYAIYYNSKYDVLFLGTQSWPGWPLWEVSEENLVGSFAKEFNFLPQLFHLSICALVVFLYIFVLLNRSYLPNILSGLFILIFTGCLVFYVAFFVGIADNLYYLINLMIAPVITFICSIMIIKKRFPNIFSSTVFRLLIIALVLLNIANARTQFHEMYYHGGKGDFVHNNNFYKPEFRKFIDSIGIGKDDKIISIPDITPNVTLYLIDRPGWSNYKFPSDSLGFEHRIDSGAKYLVVSDLKILQNPVIRMFSNHYLAKYGSIYVYKLLKEKRPQIIKDSVSLLADNGKFVSLKANGEMIADRDNIGSTEKFNIVYIGNNLSYIVANNGKFISAKINDQGIIKDPKDWIAEWETFNIVQADSSHIAIKAANRKYVTTEENTNQRLIAHADQIGPWEKFKIVLQPH